MNTSSISMVATHQIRAGENDRQHFDPRQLADLAASIREHGLAQPITIRPIHDPEFRFEIVAGERRFRACVDLLQWDAIPAIIRDLDDEQASAIMLAENTSRADLNPIEEANAYAKRLDHGWPVAKIAQVAGVSEDRVTRRLSLLTLVEDIQHLVKSAQLPIGHAEVLTPLDANRQRIALRIYNQSSGMSLVHFRHIVNTLLEEQSQESLFSLEAFWVAQVQKAEELPRRGTKAFTNAPTRNDLPQVRRDVAWSAAKIIDHYIADLLSSGHTAEAGALGNLYNVLVAHNYMGVPLDSALRKDES